MIGQHDNTWKTVPLAEVATIERSALSPADIKNGTVYVGLENLDSSGGFLAVGSVLTGDLASTKFKFTPDHILYGKLRPYLAKIARPTFSGVCSTDILPIRPNDSINKDFLFFYLRQPHVIELATAQSSGANLPRLSPKHLAQFRVPVPPIAEQKRIAAILDQADAIRRKQRQAVDVATDLIPAIFHNMFGSAVANDHGWTVVNVSEAGEVLLGRQRAPKYQTGEHTTPYMRVANVFEDRIDTSDVLSMDFDTRDFARFKLAAGDILLNEGQSTELVGRPAMWRGEIPDCCFQNTLVRFRAYADRTEPEYALSVFLQYLHAGEFAKVSSKTSNVAPLGAGRFGKQPFPLPPVALQQEFARKVEAARAIRDRWRLASDTSHELFASLVQRAFRGDL